MSNQTGAATRCPGCRVTTSLSTLPLLSSFLNLDSSTMDAWHIPPIIVAFIPPFGFSCLDAIAAYMVNMVGMSVFQVMAVRNVRCPVRYCYGEHP